MPSKEVNDILKKYSQKIEQQVKGFNSANSLKKIDIKM